MGQVMEGFVRHQEDLVLNSLGDGEPVELDEDGGDVFMIFSTYYVVFPDVLGCLC